VRQLKAIAHLSEIKVIPHDKSIALLKKQYASHFKFKSISYALKSRFEMQKVLNTNPMQLTTIFLKQPATKYTRYELLPFITT